MSIKTIELTNFKSFNKLKIDLDRFNILIGANASGKSNFIQIFKFLRDITIHGLENAIWMQGGVEYFRNVNLGYTKNFTLRIHCESDFEYRTLKKINNHPIFARINEIDYELVLEFQKTRQSYRIVKEELSRKFDLFKILRKNRKIEKKEIIGSSKGKVTISRIGTKIKTIFVPPESFVVNPEDIFLFMSYAKFGRLRKSSLLEGFAGCVYPSSILFDNIAIYDIDSRVSKKAIPIKGIAKLEEDGSNLAVILNNILTNREKERKFSMLLKDLLPFIKKMNIYRIADKSFLIRSREKYFQNKYFPAPFISDGTIHIVALLIALYFEKDSEGEIEMIKIIEEPERNIHPHLIFKVIDMMKNASKNSQIITTSHNPEMVRHADIENILLLDRDKDGFSRMFRPLAKKEIQTFLEKEIGIEELYVKNLLGI